MLSDNFKILILKIGKVKLIMIINHRYCSCLKFKRKNIDLQGNVIYIII